MLNTDMVEKQRGEIEISDISPEVMSQFLHFVYSGRLQNKRQGGKDEPEWVRMLPELVKVADKVARF